MPEPKYHSYLLRLWRESAAGKPTWRFVVVNLLEGEQRGFAGLEQVIAFLKKQMDALVHDPLEQGGPGGEETGISH
jgi:hypothetical protein